MKAQTKRLGASGGTLSQTRKSKRGITRREAILTAAADLFHRQGFHATGIDEIGAAVGVTGPAVYRHFESKHALLAAILDRSMASQQEVLDSVTSEDCEPREALERLVRRSAEALVENRDAAGVYFQEARNLPPDDHARYVRVQRSFIAAWTRLLRTVRPELSEDDARTAVQAVGGLLNSVQFAHPRTDVARLSTLLADMALSALLAERPARRSR